MRPRQRPPPISTLGTGSTYAARIYEVGVERLILLKNDWVIFGVVSAWRVLARVV